VSARGLCHEINQWNPKLRRTWQEWNARSGLEEMWHAKHLFVIEEKYKKGQCHWCSKSEMKKGNLFD
jgi:hypothetical protein